MSKFAFRLVLLVLVLSLLANGVVFAQRFKEQCRDVLINIAQDKVVDADAAFRGLVAGYSGDKNIAEAVCYVGDRLRDKGKYGKARHCYQWVVDNKSSDYFAMWAQCGVVRCYILSGNYAASKTAAIELLTNYSSHENIVEAVSHIVTDYRSEGLSDKVNEFFQDSFSKFSSGKDAMWGKKAEAALRIAFDDGLKEATVTELLNNYSGHGEIGAAVCQVGDAYKNMGKPVKAQQLYKYVVDNFPSSSAAMWAQVGLINARVGVCNDPNEMQVEAAKLYTDYLGHPDIGMGMWYACEGLYKEGMARRSVAKDQSDRFFEITAELLEKFRFELADYVPYEMRADVRIMLAESYCQLGQHEKAADRYKEVVANWPGHELAYHAQFMVGKSYEKLKLGGKVPRSQAESEMRTAFQAIIDNYPDSSVVTVATRYLNTLNEGGQQ